MPDVFFTPTHPYPRGFKRRIGFIIQAEIQHGGMAGENTEMSTSLSDEHTRSRGEAGG
jgi:hypothetical protein